MYVCMYVCVYVCASVWKRSLTVHVLDDELAVGLYVCMHVCMGALYVCMHVFIEICMHACMEVLTDNNQNNVSSHQRWHNLL